MARFPGGHLHLQLSVLFAALHILRAGCRGLSPEGERHTGPQQRAGGSREHRGALWALPDQGKAWGSWDGVTCRVLRNGCWGHSTVAGRPSTQPAGGESAGRGSGPSQAAWKAASAIHARPRGWLRFLVALSSIWNYPSDVFVYFFTVCLLPEIISTWQRRRGAVCLWASRAQPGAQLASE